MFKLFDFKMFCNKTVTTECDRYRFGKILYFFPKFAFQEFNFLFTASKVFCP